VELVDGALWPVPIGSWHGDTAGRVVRALPNDGFVVTMSSLPTGSSVPDPDCWVRPALATPAATVSGRLSAWRHEDVLLVVEVSDETVEADLTIKADLYAAAGYGAYWVVTWQDVHTHSDASANDYQRVELAAPSDRVTVPNTDVSIPVAALIASSDGRVLGG
jgi:hypothetical protein